MSNPIKYGMTTENCNLIIEKAMSKKDGVYTSRGVAYKVKSGDVINIAYDGKILEFASVFAVVVGRYITPYNAGGMTGKEALMRLE